ncbi:hypothetical protein HO173_011977 [Letharia columbiana]|uniref:Uncharacterized protein n=1 Tax=Letharia columbiana TaxID=112416 RepID=A0A8H6CQE6_9LECA|nr:uncharacterized protein HO173_011977 [Letharia columbiana]KAF6227759.1 hypothetical protein HO173_011977 [Letharia columbiana]
MLRFLAESEPQTGYATVFRSLDVDGCESFNLEGLLKALERSDNSDGRISSERRDKRCGFAGRLSLLKRIVKEWRNEDFVSRILARADVIISERKEKLAEELGKLQLSDRGETGTWR